MGFASKLKESMEKRSKIPIRLRPEILLLPQIPKPMHGVAPRVVLGTKWWDEERNLAYKTTDYHCIACGVPKEKAKGPKWLEGHEVYETDYLKGRMTYLEAVPLCHFCHNFIHQGRLQALLDKHLITQQRFVAIIQHGEKVLASAGLKKPPPYEGKIAAWSTWRLVLNGKKYKPRFKSEQDWLKHFAGEENAEVSDD